MLNHVKVDWPCGKVNIYEHLFWKINKLFYHHEWKCENYSRFAYFS